MKNKIFTNTDENKFAREVLPILSGLFLVKGSIKLDDTHLSLPTETFPVILTADMNGLLHSLVICSQGVFFDDEKVWDIEDGAITEEKLDTALTAKVNNNVKTVAQTLTGSEVDIASKNLKFRDANGNFFADRKSYDGVAKLSIVPKFSMFGNNCFSNTFGEHCSYNTFGNSFWGNTFGDFCTDNTFGNYCNSNIFGNDCSNNIFGSNCSNNIFGNYLQYAKIDSEIIYIELKSKATSTRPLKNIHILSGVRGKSKTERLVINIPDECLNSSRELIITTKRTDGGPSTPDDIVMYYADEVVDKQNKQDNTLATTSKEIVGAINELFNGAVQKSALSPVPLTATTSTNKTQLDLFLSKAPNAQVMHCTYKGVYAGTLHKINGSWYGVLVGESNTIAGQLSIKLQADGTIVEGTA